MTFRLLLTLLLAFAFGAEALAETRFPSLLPKKGAPNLGFRLDEPVHMNADTLTYDEDTGIATAEGNVELSLGSRTMRADRIVYDSGTGEADLSGKVRYKDADEEFSFDRITINLDTERGVLYNGTIRISSSNYLIASNRIEKTGKSSFLVEKGMLTTCPCEPEPDWKIEVRRSRVTLDEYAVAKDVTFRIRGVPVLWLPWGAFPVKLTRQSGLLLPNYSSYNRSRGYTFQIPYYWAINRWSDATLTLDAMSRRGYRPEVEYRIVANPESLGVIHATSFRDRAEHETRSRYYGENVFRSGAFTANGKLEMPTDPRYFLDLIDEDALRSLRHARSEGFTSITGRNYEQAVSILWNKDLQELPGPDNTVERLPEYSTTLLPGGRSYAGFDLTGDFTATRFQRRDGADEVRARGFGEVSRTVPLYRSITLTPFGFLDFLGSRFERSPGDRTESGRAVPGGGAKLSAEARKDFPGDGQRHVHTMGASAGYRFVPKVRQDDLPVTDRWSRLAPQSQIVLTFSQSVLGLKENVSPRELVSFHLEWAYDIGGKESLGTPYVDPLAPYVRTLREQIDIGAGRLQRKVDAASDIYGTLAINPLEKWRFQGEFLYDPIESSFTVGAVSGEWKAAEDRRFLAEYRISRDLAEDVRGSFAWRPLRWLGLQGQANYSIRNGYLTDGNAGMKIFPKSDCWHVGLILDRKTQPNDTGVKLTFGLKGIGSVGD